MQEVSLDPHLLLDPHLPLASSQQQQHLVCLAHCKLALECLSLLLLQQVPLGHLLVACLGLLKAHLLCLAHHRTRLPSVLRHQVLVALVKPSLVDLLQLRLGNLPRVPQTRRAAQNEDSRLVLSRCCVITQQDSVY